jgi:hypothetical protein
VLLAMVGEKKKRGGGRRQGKKEKKGAAARYLNICWQYLLEEMSELSFTNNNWVRLDMDSISS